ncbi:hypothetical protein GCM10025865_02630 [Paraoerskovia sediminicola]|uniref:Exonuclease VII large subunit C-terminal domain-containing protein n=1 Tax=Paraoerskovia sediminicola TaxID=1138587 RepID=A0ABN6X893_9CELL|nr:hypothetical protein GCM10025865_02630 [Paraoerskovia sediminicola]
MPHPLVSAIGHETDAPLLDLVADYRASTPTDAAKRIVPDVAEESRGLRLARSRIRAAVAGTITRCDHELAAIRSRPVLATPSTMVDARSRDLAETLGRARRTMSHAIAVEAGSVATLHAQVRALSPASVLERGYAVVHDAEGAIVRDATTIDAGDLLRIRVAQGELTAEAR